MSLTQDALNRLYQQAREDGNRPWKPGMQLTDAQLLKAYIERLSKDLDLARDDQFLRNDSWWTNGNVPRNREQEERGAQGIFG